MDKKNKIKMGDVVTDGITGIPGRNKRLYMVVWQRLANSGINYVWAFDEDEASKIAGFQIFNSEYVLATVVKIDPKSMPCEFGRMG